MALDSNFIKVMVWYDTQWGYWNKCLEMAPVVRR